jgi:cell cycle sensor histidine kinase DivJ
MADERATRQILLNLLSNAIKFTPNGGEVRIASLQRNGRVEFRISDTGIGIARELIDKLGDPFFQADATYTRRHDGAGLGLSVVKGLVKLHGGSIAIDSQPGMGTTVTVALPACAQPRLARIMPRPDGQLSPRETSFIEASARRLAAG